MQHPMMMYSGAYLQTYAWGDPGDGPMKERIARWTIAIVYALKMHLRRSKRAPNELLVSCPAAFCMDMYIAGTHQGHTQRYAEACCRHCWPCQMKYDMQYAPSTTS